MNEMFKFDSGMYAAGERENLYAFIIIECLPVVTESESESMPSLSVTSLSMPLAWPGLWENSPGPVLRRAHSLVMPEPCGRRHQQIGVKLFTIIGFTPQLLAIICNYWLLLLLIFCKKCCNYWLLLHHAQTLIIAIIAYLLLQLIFST